MTVTCFHRNLCTDESYPRYLSFYMQYEENNARVNHKTNLNILNFPMTKIRGSEKIVHLKHIQLSGITVVWSTKINRNSSAYFLGQ